MSENLGKPKCSIRKVVTFSNHGVKERVKERVQKEVRERVKVRV